MRPPEFTGGNSRPPLCLPRAPRGFNEAAGIHRRKHGLSVRMIFQMTKCFNEAAGIHRRKRQSLKGLRNDVVHGLQ